MIAFGVPQIITIDVLSAYVGERYSVNYTATDPDTPTGNLNWTMKSNASWLNFSAYQVLYGTPLKSNIGSYWVNISVSDGIRSDYTNFTLTVKSKETVPKGNGTIIILRTGQKFTRIQPAIEKAISGDTIYVYNGTYTETGQWYYDSNGYDHYAHFLIRKSITLIGEDKNTTIIEGNYYGHVIDVRATNVTISGFTIRKSGRTVYEGSVGLQFNDADNCVVTDNIFTDNYVGVGTHRNHRLTIKNNKIYSNKVYGIQIHMYSPDDKGDTIIDSNEIYNNGDGIYQRFHYYGPGTITNNRIYNNNHGIDFLASYNKIITGNEIKNNKIGIYFEGAINNTIYDNVIISNRNYGLYLTDYNPYAGYERPSFDNVIYHNDIISNGVQAYDYKSGVNNWNSTKIKEGNYWSDYTTRYPKAKSIGGIWDTPYDIKDRAKDFYPLANMTTYEGPGYEVPELLPPEITNVSIKQNSIDILINISEVVITFSKPMNRTEVESSLSISPSINYTLVWEKHNTVLRIIFTENLTYNTTYTISLKLVTEGYSVNTSYSPFKLVFTTEPGIYAGHAEEPKDDVPIGVQVIFLLVTGLIILFLTIMAMITKNLRKRREELEKTQESIEFEDEAIVTNGIYEVIYKLKKDAMVPEKPSAFGLSNQEMLENFNKKYEKGEISKETFEIIKSSLTTEKPRKLS